MYLRCLINGRAVISILDLFLDLFQDRREEINYRPELSLSSEKLHRKKRKLKIVRCVKT